MISGIAIVGLVAMMIGCVAALVRPPIKTRSGSLSKQLGPVATVSLLSGAGIVLVAIVIWIFQKI